MKAVFIALAFLLTAAPCAARTLHVDDDGPADFNTIQAAINWANEEDVIVVAPGTYYGQVRIDERQNIRLLGSGPETTIIDGQEQGHVVIFNVASGLLRGFKITNGGKKPGYLGGIFTSQSDVDVINNIVSGNNKGIIFSSNSSGAISCNKVVNNADDAITLISSSATISNNVIVRNDGMGIDTSSKSTPLTIVNNTIADNQSQGIELDPSADSKVMVRNNIICNNLYGIHIWGEPESVIALCNISYNNCWSNQRADYLNSYGTGSGDGIATASDASQPFDPLPGIGEISVSPLFSDPNNNDYHLKSQTGRWDPNSNSWIQDDITSPCIDAGDPATPIGYETFSNGGIINMGAYGGTAEASKSYFGKPTCETIVSGDINGDCTVDLKDFAILCSHWLQGASATNAGTFIKNQMECYLQTDKYTYHTGEIVQILFSVKNLSSKPMDFTFPTSCQASFDIMRDEELVWYYPKGANFAITHFSLPPGMAKQWKVGWNMIDENDTYETSDDTAAGPGLYEIVVRFGCTFYDPAINYAIITLPIEIVP